MIFAPSKEEGVGTISSILSRSIVKAVYNDGDRTYLTIQQESRNSTPISSETTAIIIPLTNPNVDVVQFDKSFIRIDATVRFNLSNYAAADVETLNPDGTVNAAGTDTEVLTDALATFIGLKNSSDCIAEYAVYHKGKQVSGTLQSNATVESFLYHATQSESDLLYKTNTHSIASKVQQHDDVSRCGEYITLTQLQAASANGFIDVNFSFNIPFTDILIFQQFKSYPAALFGDLEIRFKFNKNAFVSMQCNPYESIREAASRAGAPASRLTTIRNPILAESLPITNEYSQVGDQFTGITHAKIGAPADTTAANQNALAFATANNLSWTPTTINITNCYSIICGYRVQPDSLEKMRVRYETNPWVKFSQNINFLPFSSKPTATGFNISQQAYLNNTTDFILLFPTSTHESGGTVYKNPMLDKLSLTTMNRRYPESPLDTCSAEFTALMLGATDSFHRAPLQEYADSLGNPRWGQDATGAGVHYYSKQYIQTMTPIYSPESSLHEYKNILDNRQDINEHHEELFTLEQPIQPLEPQKHSSSSQQSRTSPETPSSLPESQSQS